MNKLILTGNICRDIEVGHYNDRKYIKNSIAVRRDYKNKDGEYDTDFFNFTIWGNQAEFIEKFGHKGDKICICGKILNNNYEKDGTMVYSTDIQVENIEILSYKNNGNDTEIVETIENTAKEVFGDDVVVEEEKAKEISIDDLLE